VAQIIATTLALKHVGHVSEAARTEELELSEAFFLLSRWLVYHELDLILKILDCGSDDQFMFFLEAINWLGHFFYHLKLYVPSGIGVLHLTAADTPRCDNSGRLVFGGG